jgi:hypothetical protein
MPEVSDSLSAVEQRQGDRIPWGWVVGTAVGLEVALIVLAVAWVAIYSYLIHPGEEPAYYQNYAQKSSPVVAVVLGMPLWYFACRWVGRKAGTRAVAMCVWAWFILFLIELPLYLLSELQAYDWMMVAISHSTKLIAAYLGGRAALKRVS